MNEIVSGVLKMSSELNIQDILEFDMRVEKNSHSLVHITGIISEESGMEPIFSRLEGSTLMLFEAESRGDKENLSIFGGLIKTVEIWQEGNGYRVRLEAISSTELLDQEEKSRSFQDIHMTYKELVRNVLADTKGTQVIFHIEDCELGKPIYQYRETDWGFLKRIAAQLGTSLLPGGLSSRPELHFGLPDGKRRPGEDAQLESIWFDRSYDTFDKERYRLVKGQFICREIKSGESWKLGDRITIGGSPEMAILSKRCRLEKGFLVYRYTAAAPQAFKTTEYDNSKMMGASLSGTVLETNQENVRVGLDIDAGKTVKNCFWYPWMPETGNMMYCMPEVGERITITFDDGEGSARASGSIRVNGAGNGEMKYPSNRYFTTTENKRLYVLPDCLGFVDLKQKVPLKIELHDVSGAGIESSREISMLAKKGVWLKGRKVFFQALQEISIVRRDIDSPTVLNLCNGFDSIGKYGRVKMKGSSEAVFPVLDSEDSESYDLRGAEAALMYSTPSAAGRTALERQIRGTKVEIVSAGP